MKENTLNRELQLLRFVSYKENIYSIYYDIFSLFLYNFLLKDI